MKTIIPVIKELPIGTEEITVDGLVKVNGVFENQDTDNPKPLPYEVNGEKIILPKTDKQLVLLCERYEEVGEPIYRIIFPDDYEDDE